MRGTAIEGAFTRMAAMIPTLLLLLQTTSGKDAGVGSKVIRTTDLVSCYQGHLDRDKLLLVASAAHNSQLPMPLKFPPPRALAGGAATYCYCRLFMSPATVLSIVARC